MTRLDCTQRTQGNMTQILSFTGERMVPERADDRTFWEHIYRYRFAARLAKGKKILDIACGEGYGAAALAKAGAAGILGVDVSAEACAHAASKYGIEARVGDAQKIPAESRSFNLIVSFETIEHLLQPELFVAECARVLAPGGTAVISTPNRDVYRQNVPNNPFHLKELSESEFSNMLGGRFSKTKIFSQCPRSVAWWSTRAFASQQSSWHKMRGFGFAQSLIKRLCAPELADPSRLERSRRNPVGAILNPGTRFCELANPYAIRPRRPYHRESSVYLIAVASL